ncbi:MAG: hypothetical protein J6A84_04725 [Clostridia bacterium]|nr:hypothetical protein [Clostridia bacterium]
MKKAVVILVLTALVFSHAACAVVAYHYSAMLCDVAHNGTSAPASVAFLLLIPFLLVVFSLLIAAHVCYKKSRKGG